MYVLVFTFIHMYLQLVTQLSVYIKSHFSDFQFVSCDECNINITSCNMDTILFVAEICNFVSYFLYKNWAETHFGLKTIAAPWEWVTPGVGTAIFGHGRKVPWWWPPFLGFSIQVGPYFIPQHNPIDSHFQQKCII